MPEVHIPDAPLITTPSESSEVPGIVCLRVKVPENASVEDRRNIEEVNRVLYGYYKLSLTMQSFHDNPLKESELPQGGNITTASSRLVETFAHGETLKNFNRVIGLSRILLHIDSVNADNTPATSTVLQNGLDFLHPTRDETTAIANYAHLSVHDQDAVKNTLRTKAAEALEPAQHEHITYQEIPATEGVLEILKIKLSKIMHEVGGNATMMMTALQTNLDAIPPQKKLEFYQNSLNILSLGFALSTQILENEYQQEYLTLQDVSATINSTLNSCFAYAAINFRLDFPDVLQQSTITWSSAWITALTRNLALNSLSFIEARKIVSGKNDFAGKFLVQAREVTIHGHPHLQMTVTDNGLGFDGAILKEGFQHGLTIRPVGEKGNGIGMALNKRALEKYKGSLDVENIYDEQGNRDGARVIITIPIHQ